MAIVSDPAVPRYDRKWLSRDQRIEMKLDVLLESVPGALSRYYQRVRERFPVDALFDGHSEG